MKKYLLLSLLSLTIASGTNLVGMEPEKTCDLCFDQKKSDDFNQLSCCHYDASCSDCYLAMIKMSLAQKTINSIQCPNRTCRKCINANDIAIITKRHPKIHTKYLNVATDQYMTHEKGVKHCPTADCLFSFINDAGLKQKFKCPRCQHIYCSDCLEPHAPEMTCAQAAEHRKNTDNISEAEKTQTEWLQKNTKACPQCSTLIQKNGGCFHMTCVQCKYDFCWKCSQHHDGTSKHPCGFFGNAADREQAHQELLGDQDHHVGHHANHNGIDMIRLLIRANANVNRPANTDVTPFIFIQPRIIEPGANIENILHSSNRPQHNGTEQNQGSNAARNHFAFINPLDQALMDAGLSAEQVEALRPAMNAAHNNMFHGGNAAQRYGTIAEEMALSEIPLELIVRDDNPEERIDYTPALFHAVQTGNFHGTRAILNNQNININVNQPNNNGETPLFLAVLNGHTEIVELLAAHPNISPFDRAMARRIMDQLAAQNANQQQANPLPQVTIPDVIQQLIDDESSDDELFEREFRRRLGLLNDEESRDNEDADAMDPDTCIIS